MVTLLSPQITPGQEPADPEGCASPVSSKPFTLDDLRLLVDFFYLPHQHGERSLHILEEFCWLKENAPGRWKGAGRQEGEGRGGSRDMYLGLSDTCVILHTKLDDGGCVFFHFQIV